MKTHLVNAASPLAQGDSSDPAGSAIFDESVVQIREDLLKRLKGSSAQIYKCKI